MTKSQELIRSEAVLGVWERQGITSIKGGIRRDYFARGRVLVEVRYDALGKITEAIKRTISLTKGTPRVLEHLTARDSDKVARVVAWFQPN